MERKLGEILNRHGGRRARYRGSAKTLAQELMASTTTNIKRIIQATPPRNWHSPLPAEQTLSNRGVAGFGILEKPPMPRPTRSALNNIAKKTASRATRHPQLLFQQLPKAAGQERGQGGGSGTLSSNQRESPPGNRRHKRIGNSSPLAIGKNREQKAFSHTIRIDHELVQSFSGLFGATTSDTWLAHPNVSSRPA